MNRGYAPVVHAPTRPVLGSGAERAEVRAAMVTVDRIRMHPRNVRRTLTGLDELATSIRYEGVLQPLVAHQKYRRGPRVQDLELIAGHRRLAAAEIAGLRRVPVFLVPTLDDDEAMLAMLAENTQRMAVPMEDLGRAVVALHEEFGYPYPAIARRLGISAAELRGWRQGHQIRAVPPAASGRPPRRSTPAIRPTQVYELCQRWAASEIDPTALAAEVRSWLGDWAPADQPVSVDPRGVEPDWAEVEQLLAGYRRAGQASPAACQAAVRQLTRHGMTAAQIAARIGMSERHVVRYRNLPRGGGRSAPYGRPAGDADTADEALRPAAQRAAKEA